MIDQLCQSHQIDFLYCKHKIICSFYANIHQMHSLQYSQYIAGNFEYQNKLMASLFQLLKSQNKKVPFKNILTKQSNQQLVRQQPKQNQENYSYNKKTYPDSQHKDNKLSPHKPNYTKGVKANLTCDQFQYKQMICQTSRSKPDSSANQRMKLLKSLKQKRSIMKKQNGKTLTKNHKLNEQQETIIYQKITKKQKQNICKIQLEQQQCKTQSNKNLFNRQQYQHDLKQKQSNLSLKMTAKIVNIKVGLQNVFKKGKQTKNMQIQTDNQNLGNNQNDKNFYEHSCQTEYKQQAQLKHIQLTEQLQKNRKVNEGYSRQFQQLKHQMFLYMGQKYSLQQQNRKYEKHQKQIIKQLQEAQIKLRYYQSLNDSFKQSSHHFKANNEELKTQNLNLKGSLKKITNQNKLILEDMHRLNEELYENWSIVKQVKVYLDKILNISQEQQKIKAKSNNQLHKIINILEVHNFNGNLFD